MLICMRVVVTATAILVSLLAACRTVAQAPPAAKNLPVDGVWRCQMNGFPALTLLVTDEPGILTGAILFYFQQRTTEKDPWTSVPGLPEPIFHPQFDGKTLLFEVSHRRAHPPRTLSDRPKHFRLTLLEPDKAELVNVDEPGMTCKVIRSDH
jgi:hypothetical protein